MSASAGAAGPEARGGWPAAALTLDDLIGLARFARPAARRRPKGLSPFPGPVPARRKGQGLEFEELRAYAQGDDVRIIDWKVTARRGEPFSRLFREERERAATVALDLRPSMFTGLERLRAVRASEIAGALLWQAARGGDRLGVAIQGADGIRATRPAAGMRGLLPALRAVADAFEAGLGDAGRDDPPLDDLFSFLARAGRASGEAVLVSALDGSRAGLAAALAEAGARGRLRIVLVVERFDDAPLPPGRYGVGTPGGPKAVRLDAAGARAVAAGLRAETAALAELAEGAGVPLLAVIEQDPDAAVAAAMHAGFVSGS